MAGEIRIGTSGYIYRPWRGRFYPEKLPVKKWFEFYCQHFDTVEINNTFYRLGTAPAYRGWREQAPRGFRYTLKCNRFITHNLKLAHPEEALDRFFTLATEVRPHLGPVLYQLPPHWRVNIERLAQFCRLLPKRIAHVMEFREPSWLCEEVFEILHQHNIGLCVHDLLPNHPRIVTCNLGYVRFHGATGKYAGSYSSSHLREWAAWLQQGAASGQTMYAYFNNDIDAAAVRDAALLKEFVSTER
jgi:uncharacterized protein YecE (DUF72 family)